MRHARPFVYAMTVYLVALFVVTGNVSAQESGETVVKRGIFNEDLYVAGGTVDIGANVAADVVAAGGNVTIDEQVHGDILAAGGTLNVRARVADDVRIAGGNVTIDAAIRDDAIAAGGTITLTDRATVGGRAWLAGGTINIGGKIGKSLKAAGGKILLSGQIAGDAEIAGDRIEIRDGAVINGNLRYRSAQPARIDPGAKILGTVTRLEGAAEEHAGADGAMRAAFYLSLMISAIVFFLIFPGATLGVAQRIQRSPWIALGLGAASLVAIPIITALLLISMLGIWIALAVLALYAVMLLSGYLVGAITIGDALLRIVAKRKQPTKGKRVLSIISAFVALWIISLIPILGGLVCFSVLLFGTGALANYLWRRYRGIPA